MPERPRKWWVAGFLSLVVPGLGQIYNGQPKRGLVYYVLIWVVYPAALLIAMGLPSPPFNIIGAFILLLSTYAYIVGHAMRIARTEGQAYRLKAYNRWYLYLAMVLLSAFGVQPAASTLIKAFLAQAYRIPSGGMLPTLLIGDHILVEKFGPRSASLARGDVIVFPYPHDEDRDFIMRIVGLPGEVLEIREDQVYINDRPLSEPYAIYKDPRRSRSPRSSGNSYGPVTIPQGKLFVLGDNRDQSQDSRHWGLLDMEKIGGKVRTIYRSWDADAHGVRWQRIGQPIR
ncbi:MAG: signal peptidase I [Candidatus Methylomirabilales bacterium]